MLNRCDSVALGHNKTKAWVDCGHQRRGQFVARDDWSKSVVPVFRLRLPCLFEFDATAPHIVLTVHRKMCCSFCVQEAYADDTALNGLLLAFWVCHPDSGRAAVFSLILHRQKTICPRTHMIRKVNEQRPCDQMTGGSSNMLLPKPWQLLSPQFPAR
eukprot:s1084_g6.t1